MNPPDNAGWYHAAYIVAALMYVGYIVSLRWRRQWLQNSPK